MAKVMLISYTKESELIIASAAKLCYSSKNISELQNDLTPTKIKKFIEMLAKLGHESPIEHASFTFAVEGVSRTLLAQITRHRIASFSVQSQRYVSEEKTFSYVTPVEIEKSFEALKEFKKAMDFSKKSYDNLVSLLKKTHIKNLVQHGKTQKEAENLAQKLAIEDARFVLPGACVTKMICTFNARSLMNFFSKRLCNRAQWEIRSLAILMLKAVLEVAPNLFSKAAPSCVFKTCSEGNMCCKKQDEVRLFFKNILKSDEALV